jgi:hypothetical protein
MGCQQSPHLLQLGWANGPALHDQTLFHAPTLYPPPSRVQPKRTILLLASRPRIRYPDSQVAG